MPIQPSLPPNILRSLPEHPDLDQLKTQAKELLKATRQKEPRALADFDRHLKPKNPETVKLAQAQLVLARSYGYDSWPKLKAFVDGVNKQHLVDAIRNGDVKTVSGLLQRRPELVNATTGTGEQRMIHLTVMQEHPQLLKLLMDHGADAQVGIWPHRDCTRAYDMAKERGLTELVEIIETAEAQRQTEKSKGDRPAGKDVKRVLSLIRERKPEDAVAEMKSDPGLMRLCDPEGNTPLHTACSVADPQTVEWLIAEGVDLNSVNRAGDPPMDCAVLSLGWHHQGREDDALEILQMLVNAGVVPTALGACAMGDLTRIREIHNADPLRFQHRGDLPGNRGESLTRAVQFGQLEAVRLLLDLGLDPDEPIPLGRNSDDEEAVSWGSPLWNAAAFGRLEIARLLLERGADANANVYAFGWPLDRAYERGDREMIDLLYEHGANPSAYTVCAAHDLEAALRMIEREGDNWEVMRELVWSSACCTALPIFEKAVEIFRTFLPSLSADQIRVYDLLLQPMRLGIPNDHIRRSDYHHDDRFVIMQGLLDLGLNPNAPGRFGLTALNHAAAREGLPEEDRCRFVTQLLDMGADPCMRDELLCSSVLGWACRYGRVDMVALLLCRGVRAKETEAPSWATPLAWAEKGGFHPIRELLIKAGA